VKIRWRLATLCCGILLILAMSAPVHAAGTGVYEQYDNTRVIYGYAEDGSIYIPVGEIWRQFGRPLSFDAKERKASFVTDQGAVSLELRSDAADVDGKSVALSRPLKIIQDKIYVPVRDAAKLLGVNFKSLDPDRLELLLDDRKLLVHVKPITSAYLYQPKKIHVLMYHHFHTERSDSTTVTADRFREHLDALIRAGYETITEEDLYQFKIDPDYRLPRKPLLITIDDGYENNYEIAYPILKEKGLRATIYVITSYRGQKPGVNLHFGWEKAREMYDSGVINIESHTHNLHYYKTPGRRSGAAILARLDGEDEKAYRSRILEDLKTSRDLIREHLGKESISLAYPYGIYDQTVLDLARQAGFKLHVTIREGANVRDGKLLINRFNADGRYTGEQLVRLLNGNRRKI